MSEIKNNDYIERICEANHTICSPFEASDEDIYFACHDGYVYRYKEGNLKQLFEVGGQPSGILIDPRTSICYIADSAHQSVLAKSLEDKTTEFTQIVSDFEGQSLEGPSNLMLDCSGKYLYFTDSGPFGETNIENPVGSVFVIDLEDASVSPLAFRCLAYPADLTFDKDETVLYVAETFRNRVLKFYLDESVSTFTVFHQFNGRMGPTAVAVNNDNLLFVARFEKMSHCLDGEICVLQKSGKIQQRIVLPDYPEINGISFSKVSGLCVC
jgi:sugar lactone lactonase YvrE